VDNENKIVESLDRIIKEFINNEAVPGLSVGVVYNREIIYTKGFGVKNVDTLEPVESRSIYHMASVSKTFVATGIMQLVEKGKINLDSCLIEYLPYFQLKDERYKRITIRQLLSHVSGMPDAEDYEWDKPQYDEEALERYVKSIKEKELLWEPGEKFAYSNIGFEILGDVIAKVSGMSFEQYMKENILDVLQMEQSNFYKPSVSEKLIMSPHILDVKEGYGAAVSEIFPYNRAHGPSSTLYSNVVELCNYAIANMDEGGYKQKRILKPSSYLELWQEQTSTGWEGYISHVGLAWFLGEYKGNKVRSHSGMDTGFRSNLIILPEKGIAVIIMTNSDYIGLNTICKGILDILLGERVNKLKKSLVHHLGKKLFSENLEAALREYKEIKENSIEDYNVFESEFSYIAQELVERERIGEAILLLKMSIKIFPKSSELCNTLEKCYLLKGYN
jgi:CubicO group peptidase (beta-lactamase class C family)